MASNDPRIEDLERYVAASTSEPASWRTPDDVSRMSFEALATDASILRTVPSTGVLRFSGAGVSQSAGSLSEIGRALHQFQRLATAIAAADENDRALGREASTDVQRKSRLMIAGGPGLGSLVFNLMPEMLPEHEVADGPDGAVSMFREPKHDDQRIDQTVSETISLMGLGGELMPDLVGSEFIDAIASFGPRTAACMRDFTRTMHRSGFDVDLEWRQPQRPTSRVHLRAESASLIVRAIELSRSDTQPIEIEGRVLTVSTMQKQAWLIEPNDGDPVAVRHSNVPPEQTIGIATHDRVRIVGRLTTSVSTSGVSKAIYEATHVERIVDPAN